MARFSVFRLILLPLSLFIHSSVFSHSGGHHGALNHWDINDGVYASFVTANEREVILENHQGETMVVPLSDLSSQDKAYVQKKIRYIAQLNANKPSLILAYRIELAMFLLLLAVFALFSLTGAQRYRRLIQFTSVILVSCSIFIACNDDPVVDVPDDTLPANNPAELAALFESFSGVTTSSDDTYFYVSSNGIPSHEMMTGITNWQQQVPMDHDYTGSNSWAIPLRPEIADEALSTKTNLLKGAIAIAANGIPIFNPLNNRGEDANAIGELDKWGGHCGRADDYHYHIPPEHLQATVGDGKPIAYAVDGFPVYGPTSEQLDENLGRFNTKGGYQYHTIASYPYFIAGMKGKVQLDPNTQAPENQVIPQATTKGVRPALTPLQGAEITGFTKVNDKSYTLTYTLNNETYTIEYSWDDLREYTYRFIKPDGSSTTSSYQR